MPSHWKGERLFARLGPWARLGRSNGRHVRRVRSAWPASSCSRCSTRSILSCPTPGCAGARWWRWKGWRPPRSPWPLPPGRRPPARGSASSAYRRWGWPRRASWGSPSTGWCWWRHRRRGSGPPSPPPWWTPSTWCWPALPATATPGWPAASRPEFVTGARSCAPCGPPAVPNPTSRWRPRRSTGRASNQVRVTCRPGAWRCWPRAGGPRPVPARPRSGCPTSRARCVPRNPSRT